MRVKAAHDGRGRNNEVLSADEPCRFGHVVGPGPQAKKRRVRAFRGMDDEGLMPAHFTGFKLFPTGRPALPARRTGQHPVKLRRGMIVFPVQAARTEDKKAQEKVTAGEKTLG